MTAQEAIKRIKETPLYRYEACLEEKRQSDLTKALLLAIKALEKQMPKKPVYKESTDKHEDGCWVCPVCGGTVGVYDLRDKWCSDCGTMMDWSE